MPSFRDLSVSGLQKRLANTKEYTQEQVIAASQAISKKTWRTLDEIGAVLKPGTGEKEVIVRIRDIFQAHGIEKIWHEPVVRFGKNTVLTHMDSVLDECFLQEEDIAWIDIGVVFDGIEGDVGKTYIFGDNPMHKRLQTGAEQIFQDSLAFWRSNSPTGVELYQFIDQKCKEMGFVRVLSPAGHLIGAFPHKGWKRGLDSYPNPIEPGVWILEIQIRYPDQELGAFYEDLIV